MNGYVDAGAVRTYRISLNNAGRAISSAALAATTVEVNKVVKKTAD
jgi:hypothetical protein